MPNVMRSQCRTLLKVSEYSTSVEKLVEPFGKELLNSPGGKRLKVSRINRMDRFQVVPEFWHRQCIDLLRMR
jgi:hypothetical protein